MSKIYTTEITSDQIPSDNPLHQRLLKPYVISGGIVKGDLLEVGCGEGRGIDRMLPHIKSYSAIDKLYCSDMPDTTRTARLPPARDAAS